jgi:hypothetical protein
VGSGTSNRSACSSDAQSRRAARLGYVLAIVGVVAGAPRAASAADKQACVAAYEQGQELRIQTKLRAARTQLALCAQESCPLLVRNDCVKWLREVDDRLPTLIVRARDGAGHDLSDVRVSVDGTVVADGLDGKAIAVDPGRHALRCARANQPPIDQDIVVNEGEKNRIVPLTFGADASSTGPAPGLAGDGHREEQTERTGLPLGTYILGGIAIVGVGLSVAFEVAGFTGISSLYGKCAPTCSQSTVNGYVTDLRVGDVAGAVGLVALGGALWLALSRPAAPVSALRVSPFPLASGAGAAVAGEF